MIYAPIIIPTLNRKKHLERCINSLSKNRISSESDIYISVDYPPLEKYKKGYQEVVDYLKTNPKIFTSFKSVHIYYQKENLGPNKNSQFLINIIEKKYSNYIYTEDDNEFAPNFLEYINKGLLKYEKNEHILAICGYKDTEYISRGNIIASKIYPAYGVGRWVWKNKKMKSDISIYLFNKDLYSSKLMKRLKKNNRMLYNLYVTQILFGSKPPFWNAGQLCCIDSVISIYLHVTDNICIVPQISKSRTWGNDGSGVNMLDMGVNVEEEYEIDSDNSFDFELGDDELQFNEKNYSIV